MFLDYTTQRNLQIQCNHYQITNGIFHTIRRKILQFVWKYKRPWLAKWAGGRKNRQIFIPRVGWWEVEKNVNCLHEQFYLENMEYIWLWEYKLQEVKPSGLLEKGRSQGDWPQGAPLSSPPTGKSLVRWAEGSVGLKAGHTGTGVRVLTRPVSHWRRQWSRREKTLKKINSALGLRK